MSDDSDGPTDVGTSESEEPTAQFESVGNRTQPDHNSRTSLSDVPFDKYSDVHAETERVRSDVADKLEPLDDGPDNEAAIQRELEELLQKDNFEAHTFEGIEKRRRFVLLAGNHPSIGADFVHELGRIVTSNLEKSYSNVDQQGGKLSQSIEVQKNVISALVGIGLHEETLSREITNPLTSVMQFGEYPLIRAHAAYGLEQLVATHEEASMDVSAVCETLSDDKAAPRTAAGSLIQTLAVRSPSTLQCTSAEDNAKCLVDALDDTIPQARTGAAIGFGFLNIESTELAEYIARTLLEKITEPGPSWDTIQFNDFRALVESFDAVVATWPSIRGTAVTELSTILTENQKRARPVLEVLESTRAISLSNESLVQSLRTYIRTAEDSQCSYHAIDLLDELDPTALTKYRIPSLLLSTYADSTDDIVLSAIIRTLNTIYDKIPALRSSITVFLIQEFFYTCYSVEPAPFLGQASKPEVAIINALGDLGAKQKHNREGICWLVSTVLETADPPYPNRLQRAAADALTKIAVRSGDNLPSIVYSLIVYLQDTNNSEGFDVSDSLNYNTVKITQTRLKVCESLLRIADTHPETQQHIVQQVISAATSDSDLEKRIITRLGSSATESSESLAPPGVYPDEFSSEGSSTDSREVYDLLLPDKQLNGEQALLNAIEHGNLITRAVTAKRLAAQDSAIQYSKEAVAILTETLESDPSVIARENACEILRRLSVEDDFDHESMIITLTTALEDNRHTVRSEAAKTLGDHLSDRSQISAKLVDNEVFEAAVDALVDSMKNDGGSARTSATNAVADIALSHPRIRVRTLNELCATLEGLPPEIPMERAKIGAKIRDIGRTDPESRQIVIDHFRNDPVKESIGRNVAAQLASEAILEGDMNADRSTVKLLLSGITDYNVLLEPHLQTNLPTATSRSLAHVVRKHPDLVEDSQIKEALDSEFTDEIVTTVLIDLASKCSSTTTLSLAKSHITTSGV